MFEPYISQCESSIEKQFIRTFIKHCSDKIELSYQHTVSTLCGKFVLDFCVVTSNGRIVGIECDGKGYQERSRDEWRDAMILGDGHADIIYHFTGEDITRRLDDVMYFLAYFEAELFAPRALNNLRTVASRDVIDYVSEVEVVERAENHHFKYTNATDTCSGLTSYFT